MKWNHYTCQKCGAVTVARHDQEGTTPFLIRCRARDEVLPSGARVQGCDGMAESCLFHCSQADDQKAHVIFYRPDGLLDALTEINKEPRRFRVDLLEHWEQGGALMREAARA